MFLSYGFGYLPIVGNIIAERKLSEYSRIVKGSDSKVDTKYDWYNNKYESINRNLSYRLQKNSIYREAVSNKIQSDANQQYTKIKGGFSENLTFPSRISIWTEINADDYSIKSQTLYLLGIYNTENISEEESEKMPASIANEVINLMGEDYNFTNIQLIYFDKNGGYTIESFNNTFNKLEERDMLKKTRKIEEKELPEDYLQWLANSK